MDEVTIRPVAELDPGALLRHVADVWQDESVVAHDERIFPARLPGFVATVEDEIVGHVSYRVDGGRCEITSIDASPRRAGVGTRLLEAVLGAARASGCRAAWLTTTNDNLEALRFYQRRGFRLTAMRTGAVDHARRTLKPSIPSVGSFGIPMRDEIDLEIEL